MPVTVVVGGQFGGEGKGKVAHFLSKEMNASVAIRVGGTNSGHTVINPRTEKPLILRQLPTAAILPDVTCVLGAGTYINPEILFEEIIQTGLSPDRLFIDPSAMVVTEQDIREEKDSLLRKSIGSTLSGTGAAVQRRISRDQAVKLAKDDERLQQFIQPVIPYLRDSLSSGERIIIEGTQGFGLSLLHSPYYPFATSRDTTAAAFVAEAGLSPMDVDEIVLVIRAFPIRVGGNSGPLLNEIDWETVTKESQRAETLLELTSVTKTRRRIARFDAGIVRQAIMVNRPTHIVLNHLDYLDRSKTYDFINNIELLVESQIDYLGFGPTSILDCLSKKKMEVK
ncbi:MAG: adenylosuccinate synthetase [Nitrospirae bacterium CG_4_10_14_0_8_um_filter_41_23]|nr:MAG: adenylosuccinate synthetase [Nitrospirae bacterium CG02_land_8_20_14_3_00_41_53]PIW87857.1 MAG: adenylosuccinate synthetase [Nitrospirae bacterium CG_4_8_14_3_um_filter_41_47]PIY86173.1 MAG: adenylosuccinate synthetase [Nitrospirae bacterium CG_4_10_14_0_8_um_filter_41_23]PJA80955.1 MAG: adenylosuccinate synthetase [Nitrospirae bacterium CG_4_9_14_3_um_filter_41_27]